MCILGNGYSAARGAPSEYVADSAHGSRPVDLQAPEQLLRLPRTAAGHSGEP
ncbi:hypothetical protein [Streptomyces sp. NBC_01314]|uniref:hypothetical protein n=1 Tax=Streptomyces sp. NBC_01314 TaxID=2903821 RepID=UPI003087D82E|nr:hypothetical protein OG622_46185 [Streptomyces sp. NBC_01314]